MKLSFRDIFLAVVTFTLILLSPLSQAESLIPFKAKFEVEALGMKLGNAKHRLTCQESQCILTSKAKPSGLAALLSSESAYEEIHLSQKEKQLKWLKYKKTTTTKKNGDTKKKTTLLVLDEQAGLISNPHKQLEWSAKPNVFDSISLAYGIQHAVLNNQVLNSFVLQDAKFQDNLTFKSQKKNYPIELAFADDEINAVKYHFESEHARVELWLLPEYNYFPGLIKVLNNKNQTITLSLAEPPKYYEVK